MVHQIKILKGIAPVLVGKRELRNAYVTSTELKPMSLLICLKAMTTNGHIKNYPQQIEAIKKFCKCSKSTFYSRLNKLEKMGFVSVIKHKISLSSWKKIAELHDLDAVEFHIINYDTENKGQTIEYFLKAIEIAENQQRQLKEVQRKINKSPDIELAFNSHCKVQGKTAELTLNNLQAVQCETYSLGAADYDILHSVNPDINRSAKSIKKSYGFVSIRNVAYLKRQLVKRGFAKVTNRVAPVCKYPEATKAPIGKTTSIGAIAALIMPCINVRGNTLEIKKGSKPKAYTTFYNKQNRSRIWRRTDNIELNNQLIKIE